MKHKVNLIANIVLLVLLAACATPVPALETSTTGPDNATFPITIQHEDGETTFTKPVARIVTLSEEVMELPIALGVYPVGTASERTPNAEQGKPFTYRYAEAVSQTAMTYVGLESAPSLEAIALLQPDLIITPNGYGKERYDQLSQIAPTLTFDGADRLYWQDALPTLAQLIGKEAAAQQVIAAFDAELSAARTQLAPVVATKPRLALLFLPAPTLTFMVNEQFAFGATLADLGMEIVTPDSVTFNEAGSAQVSNEAVALLETDAFVIFRFTTERFTIDELLANHPAPKLDYIINTERPAAGPITDFDYLRDLTALLVTAHGGAAAAPTTSAIATLFAKQASGYPPYDNIDLIDIVADNGNTLVIAHKYGQIEIPKAPKRLVVDHGLLEICLSLGIKPLAAVVYGEVPESVKDKLDGIEIIPGGDVVNLETIAALNPDLLIGQFYFGGYDESIYEKLSVIAPTVILRELPHWSLVTRDLAKLLGYEAQAEALFANYTQKIDAARTKMQPVVGAGTVALLQVLPEAFYLSGAGSELNGKFLPAYFATFLYRDLGFKPAPIIINFVGKQEVVELSYEKLPDVDADIVIVVPTSRPGSVIQEQATYKQLMSSPLFQAMPASKNGKVFELGPIPESYFATLEFVERLAQLMTK